MHDINKYFSFEESNSFVPKSKSFSKTQLDELPLTMAYVPFQKLGSTYEQSEALCNGTLFPELNKPFYGKYCNRER